MFSRSGKSTTNQYLCFAEKEEDELAKKLKTEDLKKRIKEEKDFLKWKA